MAMDPALSRLIDQIREAASQRQPVRIRGTGSKDFYGAWQDDTLLDTRALSGIISYEPSELVVTVRAGTPLPELEAVLAEHGQHLAFEPPRFDYVTDDGQRVPGGTCGGMVAAGLSGPARANAGSVRDHVLGVQLVNGRAELLDFGGQVIKNVAGYDVSRLMAGALGTLGLLTRISLKVMPIPPGEATLVFEIDQAGALAQLQHWGGQALPLNASCWVRDDTQPGAPERLYLRLRGARTAVEAACRQMLRDLPGQRLDHASVAADWQACRDQRLPFFQAPGGDDTELALWRLSLPPGAPVLPWPGAQLVEWHGGLRWLWAPVSCQAELRQLARQAGGWACLFRAPATAGAAAFERFAPLAPALQAIQRRIKTEFDPDGIFNPGRMAPQY